MALQHYGVPDPERPGEFIARYWQPRNTPVFDEHLTDISKLQKEFDQPVAQQVQLAAVIEGVRMEVQSQLGQGATFTVYLTR